MINEVMRVTTKRPDLDKLDSTQRLAVESVVNEDESNIIIQANAGSGKTFTLTTAIGNYRYEYINDSICAITFTRAAKAEMEDRLHQLSIYDVEVATIHAWAKSRLDKFAKKYGFELDIIQEPQIKKILKEEIVPEYLKTHKTIRSVNVDILYSFISGAKNMDVSDNYKKTLAALEERYKAYKKDNNLYDFGDYPRYLLDIMLAYDEYIYDIDALFVDEFQDVDPDQFEVFTRVDTKKKFYIGDVKQSIYQFRGADGDVFNKLDSFKQYDLQYNYRSYQVIMDYATSVYMNIREAIDCGCGSYIVDATKTPDKSLVKCKRGNGGEVYIVDTFWTTKLTEEKSDNIMVNEAFNYFMSLKPMVLCRTNKQVRELNACGLNCTTIHQAKGLEYKNVIVIDFEVNSEEDLNVAYVGLTRAEDKLMVISYQKILDLMKSNYKKSLI